MIPFYDSQCLECWFKNGLRGAGNLLRNYRTGWQLLACQFKNFLEGNIIWQKIRDWITALDVLVRKLLGGAGLPGLIGRVEPMGTGQWRWIYGWGRAYRKGALQLALEGRCAAGSSGCHELCRCCKGEKCLCQSSRIIQIGCTQIRTAI